MTRARGAIRQRLGGTPQNSFSLVELMLAMVIASVIVLALAAMLNQVTITWMQGQAHNERRGIAQQVFDHITRDLSQVSLPSAGGMNPGFQNTTYLEFIINPSGVSSQFEYPQAIFWQAPVGNDGALSTSQGNMAVVGYFIQWINGNPCLCRVLINPAAGSPNYSVYTNPTSWISSTILTNAAPATPSSNFAGLMANNVLGLWMQVLDPLGNPINQGTYAGESFDSRSSYSYTYSGTTTVPAPALPAAMQIAIMTVDSRTAKRLTGSEKPTALTGNFWTDINTFYSSLSSTIKKGVEIQSTTIPIANGPR